MSATTANQSEAIAEAMWAGDVEKLEELCGCECCCSEHTGGGCPARSWGGCRGQDSVDEHSWLRHYVEHHGMTEAQFFGE